MSDTQVDEYEVEADEVEAEVEAEVDEAEVKTRKPRAAAPTYGLAVVDGDLPEQAKIRRGGGGGGRQVYKALLDGVVADQDLWGQWIEVATFNVGAGAKSAAKAIEQGERHMPDGEWTITYRRLDGEDGARISKLYAMFTGVADEVLVTLVKP